MEGQKELTRDYSLIGVESGKAVEMGLADAEWYQSPVPREKMRVLVIALSVVFGTILPLMYVGLPTILGSWLMQVYGLTQHAGLQENVLDHRLNSRTVYMNRLHRYLYWNMNYHVEHHMFPLVPYHALPRLHELVRDDCPEPG